MRSCGICWGKTVRSWYWSQLSWDTSIQTALAGQECATCGRMTPEPDSVLALADDVPEWLLRKCLDAAATNADRRPPAKRVLVVDDDPVTRAVVRRLLGLQGFSVMEAEDGIQALELLDALWLRRELPELVLVDSVMPRMNGQQFLCALRGGYPHIVAIAMSGVDRSLPLADGSLPKPIRPHDLVSVVREALL